ncbi:MAG TPA: DUF3189 family protein [Clostridia bacterium]|jgi:hypothetical protein|nr:DUF3189 family protein [Clostridia bacterium]
MKIVYSSYYCWPLPVLAAYFHLKLVQGKKPDFNNLDFFSDADNYLLFPSGIIRKVGIDKYGNEIYIIGNQGIEGVIERVIMGFNKIFGSKDEIKFVNLNKKVSIFFKLCIYLAKFDFFKKIAVRLILNSIKNDLPFIVAQVSETVNILNKEQDK